MPPRDTGVADGAVRSPRAGVAVPLARTAVVARHNLLLVLREPGPAAGRIVMPVLLVLVLRPLYTSALGTRAGSGQAVVGVLVMFSLLGLSLVSGAVLAERTLHTLDRLRATPARPAELLAGKGLSALVIVVLQQAVLLGLGVAVLGVRVHSYGLLAVAVFAWAITLLCVGSALGLLARSQAELSATIDIGSMVISSLGGSLLPVSAMPAWAATIAPASPGYWAMRVLRAGLAGNAHAMLLPVAVLGGVAATAAGVAGLRLVRGARVPG